MTQDEIEEFRVLLLGKYYKVCEDMKQTRIETMSKGGLVANTESFQAYISGMGYVVNNLISEVKKESK